MMTSRLQASMAAARARFPVGVRVRYRSFFGNGPELIAGVTGHGWHKGAPVLDLTDGHFCYLHQVAGLAHADSRVPVLPPTGDPPVMQS